MMATLDSNRPAAGAGPAVDRVFRSYHRHSMTPDEDTLFTFLHAIHSLNDRLERGAGINLYDIEEFAALKALRNLFHHQTELLHRIRVVPIEDLDATTDLALMCIVPAELVVSAVEGVPAKHREPAKAAALKSFHWYDRAVNINPAIFNCVVKTYERVVEAGIPVQGEGFLEFSCSYLFEEANGYPHLVDGRISVHAGNIEELRRRIGAAP